MKNKNITCLFISNALIAIGGFTLIGYAVKRTGSLLPLLLAPFVIPSTTVTNDNKEHEEITPDNAEEVIENGNCKS